MANNDLREKWQSSFLNRKRRVKNHSFFANCEKKLLWIQKNFFEKITESFKSHPQNIRYIYRSLSQFFFCHIVDDAVSSSQVQNATSLFSVCRLFVPRYASEIKAFGFFWIRIVFAFLQLEFSSASYVDSRTNYLFFCLI